MERYDYLIVGSSHAALEAAHAIRLWDQSGSLALVTRDAHPPYSPTVLPYVVSGRSLPDRVGLRSADYFADNDIDLQLNTSVTGVETLENCIRLAGGMVLGYGKLLLATGARAIVPPIAGLSDVPFQVLRTLDDAIALREAREQVRSAVVLGAGLIGMHAAENLAKAGVAVTVIERESRVLAGYFDQTASDLIADAFTNNGVDMRLGHTVTTAGHQSDPDCLVVSLDNGEEMCTDLLLVAAGVTPEINFLAGSGILTDQGILVDDTMRTNVENVWAAGDVAQARNFYDPKRKVINGILPNAVEQGRIAGMAMAGDPAVKPFPGAVPLNTYTFFGEQAVAVGLDRCDGAEVVTENDLPNRRYRKFLLRDGRLLGATAINDPLDGGVLWQLILREVDLTPVREQFLTQPLQTGRTLMSQIWR